MGAVNLNSGPHAFGVGTLTHWLQPKSQHFYVRPWKVDLVIHWDCESYVTAMVSHYSAMVFFFKDLSSESPEAHVDLKFTVCQDWLWATVLPVFVFPRLRPQVCATLFGWTHYSEAAHLASSRKERWVYSWYMSRSGVREGSDWVCKLILFTNCQHIFYILSHNL